MRDGEGAVKIASLQMDNVTKIKALALEPTPDGLTVIGGKNAQGKTSVLDGICWALGGKRYEPDRPRRDGSVCDPYLRVVLSNGVVAERSGRSGALKVTDPSGARAGQALLDSFVESFALDLPKFMAASDKDKALALVRALGIDEELEKLDAQEAALSERRRDAGVIARQRAALADGLPFYEGVPDAEVDIADLTRMHVEAVERNVRNAQIRNAAEMALTELCAREDACDEARRRLDECKKAVEEAECAYDEAKRRADEAQDADASAIADGIAEAEEVNAKVRANAARRAAEHERAETALAYEELTAQIEEVRKRRIDLLDGAQMPLPGLSVENGTLSYRGDSWGSMSASTQLTVATAVAHAVNPSCGFVLVDKLEQMDADTLADFARWCEAEGLQVIGTRVGTGDECTVVIEDGMAVGGPARAF